MRVLSEGNDLATLTTRRAREFVKGLVPAAVTV
jgi:hypothetical protein